MLRNIGKYLNTELSLLSVNHLKNKSVTNVRMVLRNATHLPLICLASQRSRLAIKNYEVE